MKLKTTTAVEILLVQLIIYLLVFLWNYQVGLLLCTVFAAVTLGILVISYVVELIERSKVPAWYFQVMWLSLAAPLMTLIFFFLIEGI